MVNRNQSGKNNNSYKHGNYIRIGAICSQCGRKTTKLKISKRAFCDNKCRDLWQTDNFKGKNNPNFGKNHPTLNIGRKYSDETRLKLRNSQLKNVETQFFNGLPAMPCVGKYEYSILDYLESIWNCNIQRQKRVAGYFLDGYCPMLNLAIEIDEPRHFKDKKYLKNDNYREEQITKELNCSFLRINTGD